MGATICPQPGPDPVRDMAMAAIEGDAMAEAVAKAWVAPDARLDPAKTGHSSPPTAVRVERVHYRPGKSARLVVALEGVRDRRRSLSDGLIYLSVQIYPSLKEAEKRFASLCEGPMHKTPGPPLMLLSSLCGVAACLPNSPRLRKTRYLLQPQKRRRLLAALGLPQEDEAVAPALELRRLVPRKRALFRYAVGDEAFYIKLFTKDEHRHAAKELEAMSRMKSECDLAFEVPQLVGHDDKAHLVVMREIPGSQVTSKYALRDSALWQRCGQGLASLHRVQLPTGSLTWSLEQEYEAIRKGARELAMALPGLQTRINSLLAVLEEQIPAVNYYRPRAIHANLFGDQILDDGSRLGIVDWEDLCMGDPCFDVGRLGAHLLACAILGGLSLDQAERTLVQIHQAHREALGEDVCRPQAFAWHLIGALLLRAKIGCLRMLPKDWNHKILTILELAEGVRDGTMGPWRLAARK